MKLDAFIGQTIIDICKGIGFAKGDDVNSNGCVAPVSISLQTEKQSVHKVREIEFAVNVVVSESKELEVLGEAEVKVGVPLVNSKLKADVDNKTQKGNKTSHLVRFSVPYLAEAILPSNKS